MPVSRKPIQYPEFLQPEILQVVLEAAVLAFGIVRIPLEHALQWASGKWLVNEVIYATQWRLDVVDDGPVVDIGVKYVWVMRAKVEVSGFEISGNY